MYFHLHFGGLSQRYSCLFLHVCMRRLPGSNYLGSFCFAPFHYILHSTAAMAAPSTADATMGDATTPDRATTPEVAVTTDSSDHGTPPPQSYNDSNYHFNHSTPGNTVYYNPTTVMDQLHITEHQTTTTPPLPDNTPYTQFSLHLHLKSINYSHNNKLLHWHNWTTRDPFTASLETFGCPTTTPHCPHDFTPHYNWRQHQLRHHPTPD